MGEFSEQFFCLISKTPQLDIPYTKENSTLGLIYHIKCYTKQTFGGINKKTMGKKEEDSHLSKWLSTFCAESGNKSGHSI